MTTRPPLTDSQAQMLAYLAHNQPLGFSQREIARAAGLDHPQKAIVAVMGLLTKGYLVVDPSYSPETPDA